MKANAPKKMTHLIDKDALVAEIKQRIEDYKSHKIDDSYYDGLIFALKDLRDDFINTLEVKEMQEEPVSEDLEDAANEYIGHKPDVDESLSVYCKRQAFKAGAKWQKGQFEKEREILDESKTTNKRKRTMKFKINNDYKCVMITPSVNYWYNDKRSLFIGWLCWGFNIEF